MPDKHLDAWTDYPIEQLGDRAGYDAPIRPCKVISYDGDKYLTIEVMGVTQSLKGCYVYQKKGRCGQVPNYDFNWLTKWFKT